MAKTTFLGYVPSLKSKHEATIVGHKAIQSKGGSIRYTLQGEYQGRKTLPKTVSKADFESVYGFDAKEAEAVIISGTGRHGKENRLHIVGDKDANGFTPKEIEGFDTNKLFPKFERKVKMKNKSDNYDADTVGSPSPASVEPPAPSEKPFPQEPSNENFSAENPEFYQIEIKYNREDGWEMLRVWKDEEEAIGAYYDIRYEHPEVRLLEVDSEGDKDVIYIQRNYDLDVKEAFGFGKKEEEKEEPKTQEFTVVLQEGDKLELTDVEETEAAPDDENTEKEAETLEITDIDWETDDEDVDLPASVLVPSSIVEDEIADYLSDEYGFLVRGYVLNAETYEAVQAKVTRPVKEEEKEESDEGLSTGAKVALGVGALAAGVALFGAEEDDYDPYESETDYSRIYEASGSGEKEHDMIAREEEVMYEFRYDNPITTYDWTTAKETVSDEEEDYIHDAISDEIGSEPSEGEDNFEIDVEDVGSVDVDTNTDYGDKRHYGLAAEHESESDGYTYAYTKGHKDGMDNEVIYRPSIDTDREKTVFKKILKQKAETFEAEKLHPGLYRYKGKIGMRKGWTECQECDDLVKMNDINFAYLEGYGNATVCDACVDKYQGFKRMDDYMRENWTSWRNGWGEKKEYSKKYVPVKKGHEWGESEIGRLVHDGIVKSPYGADTVGNPSPSGPSSTPEPAEATGSEPSNENMEAEGSNMKMALGVLGVGVGAVALLGGDRIKKIFEKLGL